MNVKVCGLTQLSQVEALANMNVQYAGFIYYAKSPRYVLNHLTNSEIKNIKSDIYKVGVFVNEKVEKVLQTVVEAGLDMVQLHGNESIEYCKEIALKISVVKAFQVKSQSEMFDMVQQYSSSVDMFLFDTPSANYGGTGEKFDWNAIANMKIDKPFFLSGGISSEDVSNIQNFQKLPIARKLHAIDINSRFELNPGVKDIEMIAQFMKKLNPINYAK